MCRPKSCILCRINNSIPYFYINCTSPYFLSVPTNITVDLFGFITNLVAIIHLTVICYFGDKAPKHNLIYQLVAFSLFLCHS